MALPKTCQNAQTLLEKIQAVSSENQQLVGAFKLKGTGLKRLLGSVDLDIIAKRPSNLYLSIGSFFKQPARIVTFDGKKLYGLSEERLDEILNLAITPEDLVDVLLRSVTVNPKQIQKLACLRDQLEIQYRSGHTLTLSVEPIRFEIQTRELTNPDGELVYQVEYADFPKRFNLKARYRNEQHSMVLTSSDATLNQGVFNEQLFRR